MTRRLVAWTAAAAALFGAVAGLAAAGVFAGLDHAAFDAIALESSSAFERWLRAVVWLVSAEGSALCLLGLGVAAIAVRRIRLLVVIAALALVAAGAVEMLLKGALVQSPPPGHEGVGDASLVLVNTPYSFPSGHATRVVLLAVTAVLCLPPTYRRRAGVAAIGFVLVVLYSRLALGGHWLSDVAGGVALGAIAVPALLAADGLGSARRPRWVHSSSP
jgi:membrane-associated phospholipid phosphatase